MICDSRVIFSLNWLLFITGPKEQFVQFSKLEPRNKTCEIYSLSYLLEKYNLQPAEEKTQYKEFIEVIKALTDKLKEKQGDDWKIYCTEMLLFQIADDLEYGIPCLVRELLLNKDAVNNFSYENAIVGVALWFVAVPWKRSRWDIALMIFAFILTSLSPSDLFPKFIRKTYVQPYALKANHAFQW